MTGARFPSPEPRRPPRPRLERREPIRPRPPTTDMPEDPDVAHVPAELAALDGEEVTITGIDRETGELVRESGAFVTVPGLHGDAARRE